MKFQIPRCHWQTANQSEASMWMASSLRFDRLTSIINNSPLCSVLSFLGSVESSRRTGQGRFSRWYTRWNLLQESMEPRERIRSRARSNSNWRRPTNEATISWFPDYFAPLRRPWGTHMCRPYGGEKVSGGLEEQPWRANLFRSHPRLLPRVDRSASGLFARVLTTF